MSTYVLVHGAAHGGWCWSKVSAVLLSLGHHVVSPDLPGRYGTDIDPVDTPMDDYVRSLLDLLKATTGTCNSRRAQYGGNSINGLISADKDSLLLEAFNVSADRVFAVSNPDTFAKLVYNDCADRDVRYALERVVRQPLRLFSAQAVVDETALSGLSKTGIVCTRDRIITPMFQEQMYDRAGCKNTFPADFH